MSLEKPRRGKNKCSRLAQRRLKFCQNVTDGVFNIDLFDVYKFFWKYHLDKSSGILTKNAGLPGAL
jgi:hypothetical protein